MARMGHLEVAHVDYYLPDGRLLLTDASFRVGQGDVVALVGPNGAGKSTLLKLASGELKPDSGTVTTSGGLGVMPQFVGSVRDERTVRDLLVAVARPLVRAAALAVDAAELAIMERDDEAAQLAYAQALSDWGDADGYAAETVWDMCTMAALGVPYEKAHWRQVRTLSGGEQKRLVLEALLRGPDEVLLLDEPDNYLDVPGKLWLEGQLRDTAKTVLFVSHDRELLAQAASVIVSVEPAPGGSAVWVHGGGWPSFHEAREHRFERFEELRRRWDEKHAQLKKLVVDMRQYAARSDAMASRYAAAQTRLRMFEEAGPPPEPPRKQDIKMRLRGGRTGLRAITCAGLELTGLMKPFGLEVFYGERVAVLGSNGSGKSYFLRLLAGQDVAHTGSWKLGARVVPGFFAQTHAHPELEGRTLVGILWDLHARDRGAAMSWSARGTSGSATSPAASRPASRSCCWSSRARRPCSSTSPPTTWTSNPPRPSKTVWSPTRARSSPSPTTAGSPAPSTASSSSAPTASSARPLSRSGTRPGSGAPASRPCRLRVLDLSPRLRPRQPRRPGRPTPRIGV